MERIEQLHAQLPGQGPDNIMLRRYLDALTTYADSVVDGPYEPEIDRVDFIPIFETAQDRHSGVPVEPKKEVSVAIATTTSHSTEPKAQDEAAAGSMTMQMSHPVPKNQGPPAHKDDLSSPQSIWYQSRVEPGDFIVKLINKIQRNGPLGYQPHLGSDETGNILQDLEQHMHTLAQVEWSSACKSTWPVQASLFSKMAHNSKSKPFRFGKFGTMNKPKMIPATEIPIVQSYILRDQIWRLLYKFLFFSPFAGLGRRRDVLMHHWREEFRDGNLLLERRCGEQLTWVGSQNILEAQTWRYETMLSLFEDFINRDSELCSSVNDFVLGLEVQLFQLIALAASDNYIETESYRAQTRQVVYKATIMWLILSSQKDTVSVYMPPSRRIGDHLEWCLCPQISRHIYVSDVRMPGAITPLNSPLIKSMEFYKVVLVDLK